ncbi:MAG: hypothetical protein HC933_11930 [Pleurocapsa sp. SU_196_0]|nr:hypothetical protein [Pleurocapsa sp. SU_196_0]
MFEDNSTLPLESSITDSGNTDLSSTDLSSTDSSVVNGFGSDVEPAPKKRGRPRKNPVIEPETPSLGLESPSLEVTGHGSAGHELQGLESQIETAKPKTRGRKAAAAVEVKPSQSPVPELNLEPETVTPAPKARGRKATVSDSSSETPKPRGRKGKTVEASTPEVEEGEMTAVVPLELTPEPQLTPVLETKPKARGRKVAAVEPVTEPAKPRVRGRKASLETNDVKPSLEILETDGQTSSLETDEAPTDAVPLLEGETAPVTAPKRLVRVRKTARENVFESQAKLTNPLEVLLEYLRANPGAHALRDLEKVLDAAATFARLFDAKVHCVYAVEVSQQFLPQRVPSLKDCLFNVGGATVGAALALVVHGVGLLDRLLEVVEVVVTTTTAGQNETAPTPDSYKFTWVCFITTQCGSATTFLLKGGRKINIPTLKKRQYP